MPPRHVGRRSGCVDVTARSATRRTTSATAGASDPRTTSADVGFLDRFRRQGRLRPIADDTGGPGQPSPSGSPPPDRSAAPPDSPTDWLAWSLVPEDRLGFARAIDASPDFGVDPRVDGPGWTVALYDEIRGMCGDPAIEALAQWLADLDGVDGVEHTTREHVEVWGAITAPQLRAAVVARLGETGDPGHFGDTSLDEFRSR